MSILEYYLKFVFDLNIFVETISLFLNVNVFLRAYLIVMPD